VKILSLFIDLLVPNLVARSVVTNRVQQLTVVDRSWLTMLFGNAPPEVLNIVVFEILRAVTVNED